MSRIEPDDFDDIALGEVTPAQALTTIRKWGAKDDDAFGRYVYVALKEVSLRLLTTRARNDVSAWTNVIRQSSALLKGRGDLVHGERLLVLSDLAADWERQCSANVLEEVLARPYVMPILEAVHWRGGQAKRAEVAKAVGIGEANFSRILGTLESSGLLIRDKLRERTLTLTAEGLAQVQARIEEEHEEPAEDFIDMDSPVLGGGCVLMEIKGTSTYDHRVPGIHRLARIIDTASAPPAGMRGYWNAPMIAMDVDLVPKIGHQFVADASLIEAIIGSGDRKKIYVVKDKEDAYSAAGAVLKGGKYRPKGARVVDAYQTTKSQGSSHKGSKTR